MPGFHIHISASTMLGIGYGVGAYTVYGVPLPTAALATTLCSVAGMLPDLDSGPGRPMHESIAAAAAAIPMMLVDRMRSWGWTHETMILAGSALYLFVRFGVGHTLKHWTVHRGIFHSFPVALIFTELAFLVCSSGDLHSRYFKAAGITIGFLSHLILDEIWSVDFRHARLKSSFGTALKFWCPCWWSNTIAYALTVGTTLLTLNDPIWINSGREGDEMHQMATTLIQHLGWVEQGAQEIESSVDLNLPSGQKSAPQSGFGWSAAGPSAPNSGTAAAVGGAARFVQRRIFQNTGANNNSPQTFAPANSGGWNPPLDTAKQPQSGGPR